MWRSAFCGSQAIARSRPGILSPRPSYQAIAGLASWMASQPAITRVRARTTIRRARDSSGTRTSRGSIVSVATSNRRLAAGVTVIAAVVAIAVAVRMNVDVIENDAKQTSPYCGETPDGPLSSITAGSSVPKDEHCTLELAGQDHRIADTEHRADVEDDVGEPLPERFDHLAQARRGEQLGWIHGNPARRNHEEIGNPARNDNLLQIGLARQVRRESGRLLDVQDPVYHRPAHVRVHQENGVATELGQRDRQVGDQRGLAVFRL